MPQNGYTDITPLLVSLQLANDEEDAHKIINNNLVRVYGTYRFRDGGITIVDQRVPDQHFYVKNWLIKNCTIDCGIKRGKRKTK